MKIIPYSVLAATLMGGAVAASGSPATAPAEASSQSALGSLTGGLQTQEEAKSKPAPASGDAAMPSQGVNALPAGTTIYAELEKGVDARKAKAGDGIVARSTLPVLWQGKIIVPNQSKIVGHVTEAVPRTDNGGHSRVGILFDTILMKDGTKLPISLTVQALGMRPFTARADDPGQPHSYAGPHAINNNGARLANSNPTGPTMERPPVPDAPESNHTLDAGSYGTIGLPDLNLFQAKNPEHGSVIASAKKNVKLDSQTEIVLRVVVAPAEEKDKP